MKLFSKTPPAPSQTLKSDVKAWVDSLYERGPIERIDVVREGTLGRAESAGYVDGDACAATLAERVVSIIEHHCRRAGGPSVYSACCFLRREDGKPQERFASQAGFRIA